MNIQLNKGQISLGKQILDTTINNWHSLVISQIFDIDIEKVINYFTKKYQIILPPPPKQKPQSSIKFLTKNSHGFDLKRIKISTNLFLPIEKFQKTIINKLNNVRQKLKETSKGVALFYGKPGTGKTSFIRTLMEELKEDKNFIFVPPHILGELSNPEFLDFFLDSNMQNSILVIEDAEKAITSREQSSNDIISTLLNLGDGMLNDVLGVQAICTFNCDISKIDKALLRPGRLIEQIEFPNFSAEEATLLSNGKITKEATLAEIFCGDTNVQT